MDHGKARNAGIKVAHGKYIMFLDSDDYIETINLKEVLDKYVKKEEYELIYYNFEQVADNGIVLRKYDLQKFKECSREDLIKNTISWNLPWGQFKIILKDIIINNNIYFDETISTCEELFFTINILQRVTKVFFYDNVVYKYLKRNDSISRNIDISKNNQIVDSVAKQLNENLDAREYKKVIKNYYIISKLHLLKYLSLNRNYKLFKNTCMEIREERKNIDYQYISGRYKKLICFIKCHLYYILYFMMKVYFKEKTDE